MDRQKECLVHSSDQVVDLVLTVAKVTTLDKVIGALEVGSNSVDLVNQVLDGLETNVADVLLNNGIVVQSNALAIDLTVTALVDKLADGLEVGVTPGDVWLSNVEHHVGGLVQLDKGGIADLTEAKKLKDLLDAW